MQGGYLTVRRRHRAGGKDGGGERQSILGSGRAARGTARRPRGAARTARLLGPGLRDDGGAGRGGDLRAAPRRGGGRRRPSRRARDGADPATQRQGRRDRSSSSTPGSPSPTCSRRRSGAAPGVWSRSRRALPALVEALRKVWRGGRYFDPRFSTAAEGEAPAKALSGREAEILTLLARGLTGEEIAQRLVLSPETVRTHVRNAMGKLEARTRTEAVVKALERGRSRRHQRFL